MPSLSTDGGVTSVKFDLDEMTADQAIAIEECAGLTWLDFARGLQSGSAKAMRALAWLLQRETDPTLDINDVDFRMADFTVEAGEADAPLSEASESSSDDTESSSTSSTESDPGSGTD